MKPIKLIALLCAALLGMHCAANEVSPQQQPANNTADEQQREPEIQKIPFRLGRSSYTVGELAKKNGCAGMASAALVTEQGPVEVYRMRCAGGQTFLARCEVRQCAPLR